MQCFYLTKKEEKKEDQIYNQFPIPNNAKNLGQPKLRKAAMNVLTNGKKKVLTKTKWH